MSIAEAATERDIAPLAAMLARAFATDPVTLALFSSADGRDRSLRRFFAFQLRHHYLPRGLVDTTPRRESTALWMPPRLAPARRRDRLATPLLVLGLGRAYPFAQRLGQLLAERHPRAPHYYLGILGTEPLEQRRGHASALLAVGLARADTERVAAYLECSSEVNVAFYARHGFAVREEVLATRNGPRLWLMERPARTEAR